VEELKRLFPLFLETGNSANWFEPKESPKNGTPMKRRLFIACTLAIAPFASAKELTLIADGRSDYIIAVAEQSVAPKKISEAATLLQSAFARAAGATLRVVPESQAPDGTATILLGKTAASCGGLFISWDSY
jgi:hypothetical protein